MKKGMGARFRENELRSSQDMHGSHDIFFPTTTALFLIWVWLFEICKRGRGGGQFYVQNQSRPASYPVSLSVCEGSQQWAQSPPACWSGDIRRGSAPPRWVTAAAGPSLQPQETQPSLLPWGKDSEGRQPSPAARSAAPQPARPGGLVPVQGSSSTGPQPAPVGRGKKLRPSSVKASTRHLPCSHREKIVKPLAEAITVRINLDFARGNVWVLFFFFFPLPSLLRGYSLDCFKPMLWIQSLHFYHN